MATSDAHTPIEELLAHRRFVRSLALALTGDPDTADEVEQQTWLSALRSPPADARAPRGWLRVVLRNAVRQLGRSGARRRRRESVVARTERTCLEDPAMLTARAELHARVSAAVIELPEPYRRAILLRHFEDLPVAEVARRMGTPLETARSRLRRGRATLREALTDRVGDRRPLAIILMPLIGASNVSGRTAATTAGGAILVAKTYAMGAVAILALAWFCFGPLPAFLGGAGEAEAPPAPVVDIGGYPRVAEHARGAARSESRSGGDRGTSRAPGPGRTASTVEDAEESEPAAISLKPSIRARLGRPIEEISFEDAPLREVLGRISWHADVPIVVDLRAFSLVDETETSVDSKLAPGRETLDALALLAGLDVVIRDDRIVLAVDGSEWSDEFPVWPIEPDPATPPGDPVRWAGRVIRPDGRPAPYALVDGLAGDLVRADAEGLFACDVQAKPRFVRARMPGSTPSSFVALAPPFDTGRELLLVLGPPAACLEVHVTDAGGRPVAGAIVRAVGEDGENEVLAANEEGMAVLSETAPGRVEISVEAKGHDPAHQAVATSPERTKRVEFELRANPLSRRLPSERTTLEFEREPFRQILGTLRRRWRLDVRAEPGLPREIAEKRMTFRVFDDTLENVLRALTREAGASYRIDSEAQIVWIGEPR